MKKSNVQLNKVYAVKVSGTVVPVRLDRVEIAGEQFHDVDAVVMDGLDTNLLGQSVLRRLGRVELRGDRMVIHPAG